MKFLILMLILMYKTRRLLLMLALCGLWLHATLLYAENKPQQGVSFNFKNVDIRTIIESVAKITGKNFFIDHRVRGQVTLLSNSTVDASKISDVLKMVLSLYGFQAVETEYATVIVPAQIASGIAPKPNINKGELYGRVTEIIAINNVPTNTMSQILQPFLSQQSRVQVVPGSNKIIVSDTRINLERLRQIITQIDKVTASDFDVIELHHAAVSDVLRSVRAIFGSSQLLKLEADQRTNRLFVVSDSLDTRLAVRAIVAELDIAPIKGADSGELQVFYLKYGKATEIAAILSATLSSSAYKNLGTDTANAAKNATKGVDKKTTAKAEKTFTSKGNDKNQFSIQADEKLNAIIVTGDSKTQLIAKQLIDKLDLPRKQVSMEIIVAEISNSKLFELGFNYLSAKNGFATNLDGNVDGLASAFDSNGKITKELLGTAALANAPQAGALGAASSISSDGVLDWAVLIRAIDGDSESNLLSTPYITTLDNEKATLVSGAEVPIETGSQTTSDNSTFRTVERKKVGINIGITPQISTHNEIIMTVEQSYSSVDEQASTNGVVTQEREIATKIHARNSEIVVMGGLQQTNNRIIKTGIPLLKDIPFIGFLFSYKRHLKDISNLIVFIRPTILQSSDDIAEINKVKYQAFRNLVDKDLSEDFLNSVEEIIELQPAPPTLTNDGTQSTANTQTP